jgi:hypothetical protein
MSAVVAGVVVGALGSVGSGVGAWRVQRAGGPQGDLKRADRFAREVDLYLPQELVAPVADRLRRRLVRGLLLSALFAGPFLGYLVDSLVRLDGMPATGSGSEPQAMAFPGPAGFVLGPALGLLLSAAEGIWELFRTRRAGAPAAPTVRLRHAVPIWVIWASRALAVLPAAVAAAASAAQGRPSLAVTFVGLAALSALLAWSVERLQVSLLNTGRRSADEDGRLPQEAAFDDAFRVTSALSLVVLAPCLGTVAGAFCIHLAGHGPWYQGLLLAWDLTTFPLLALSGAVGSDWMKRYHRRGARTPTVAA